MDIHMDGHTDNDIRTDPIDTVYLVYGQKSIRLNPTLDSIYDPFLLHYPRP